MKDIISHHSLCVGWKQNLKLLRGIRKICTIEPCKLMADAMLVWNELWIIWVMVVAPLSFWHEVYQHGIHIICICERIPFCYSTKEKKKKQFYSKHHTTSDDCQCIKVFFTFSIFSFLFFIFRSSPHSKSSFFIVALTMERHLQCVNKSWMIFFCYRKTSQWHITWKQWKENKHKLWKMKL